MDLGGGRGEGADTLSPHPTSRQLFVFLLDAVVIGLELQLQGLEAEIISRQETVTMVLTFMSEFLMTC